MAVPGFVPITDPLLQNFKTCMREHLRVPAVLTVTQCIACQAPRTVSHAGRFEHERTGICEACWDTLVGQDDSAKLRQCTRLLDANAADLLMTWIMVSKTKVGGTMSGTTPGAYFGCSRDWSGAVAGDVGRGTRTATAGTCTPTCACARRLTLPCCLACVVTDRARRPCCVPSMLSCVRRYGPRKTYMLCAGTSNCIDFCGTMQDIL